MPDTPTQHDAQVQAFVARAARHANIQDADNGEFIIDGVVNVREALDAALSKAERDIITERRRQVETGWTPEHDDEHASGELAAAAGCYALHAHDDLSKRRYPDGPAWWPFDAGWWKPKTPRENLVRAAALALAEIERIDRAEKS